MCLAASAKDGKTSTCSIVSQVAVVRRVSLLQFHFFCLKTVMLFMDAECSANTVSVKGGIALFQIPENVAVS